MPGMKLFISAKNLPRARDLDYLAASGVTPHSGSKVNKYSCKLARNGPNSSGDVSLSSHYFQKVSGYGSFPISVTETLYGAFLTEVDSPRKQNVHKRQTWGAASGNTLDYTIVFRIQ